MFWSNLNSRQVYPSYSDTAKFRAELWQIRQYFRDWRKEIDRAKKHASSAAERKQISNRFITWQCYEDLELICSGLPVFLDYIYNELVPPQGFKVSFNAHHLTQDRLENDFSILRSYAGGSGHPTVYAAAYELKRLNRTRLASLQYGYE
jgi:hypothetical protein